MPPAPHCSLGHASEPQHIPADLFSATAVTVRLWQTTGTDRTPVVELEVRTARGTRHVAALSLDQAGFLAVRLIGLRVEAGALQGDGEQR